MNKIEEYWTKLKKDYEVDAEKGDKLLDACVKTAWTAIGIGAVYMIGHNRGFDRGFIRGRATGYYNGAKDFAEALLEEAQKRGE